MYLLLGFTHDNGKARKHQLAACTLRAGVYKLAGWAQR
jgi:hypothetical protein